MKIYIVRHGQTNHNVKKIYSNEDEDLNSKGINQANKLKEQIKKIDYDIIISSPLIRAKHTANIINVKNTDILIDERLTERNPGSLMELVYQLLIEKNIGIIILKLIMVQRKV